MPSFTRESGGTLHVAVMGVNRIGKDCSNNDKHVNGVASPHDHAQRFNWNLDFEEAHRCGHGQGRVRSYPGQDGESQAQKDATPDREDGPGPLHSLARTWIVRAIFFRSPQFLLLFAFGFDQFAAPLVLIQ